MAEITQNNSRNGNRKRFPKASIKLDMTPMVDLAFLLLTFFVLTATFQQPNSMELSLPVPEGKPGEVKNGLTLLLTKDNRIFYYKGEFHAAGNPEGKTPTVLTETSYTKEGLRNMLRKENAWAIQELNKLKQGVHSQKTNDSAFAQQVTEKLADTRSLIVLVKTDNEATYQNVVDVLDELKICNISKRVAGLDISGSEFDLLNQKMKQYGN